MMNPAIQKTLSLVLLILIGYFLKQKITSKEQLGGIKVLILSVALPATIFVALLKTQVEASLLALPIFALIFNVLLFFIIKYTLPIFGIQNNNADGRVMLMLLPSLAPGLSCFPFLAEYMGEESLAFAALADVGNKIFVLIILYLVAMNWYYQVHGNSIQSTKNRVKELLISLIKEPVNLVIIVAIGMLIFGLNLQALPEFLQDPILRMSAIMTPLVLLFIGMAVKVNRREFALIFKLLLWRSGLAFAMSAIFLAVFPAMAPAAALVAVVFPQSACSFWPFAHMSAVTGLEQQRPKEEQKNLASTFNIDLALNVLACSLPFSTVMILTICSLHTFFLQPLSLAGFAVAFLLLAILPGLIKTRKPAKKEVTRSVKVRPQLVNVGEE